MMKPKRILVLVAMAVAAVLAGKLMLRDTKPVGAPIAADTATPARASGSPIQPTPQAAPVEPVAPPAVPDAAALPPAKKPSRAPDLTEREIMERLHELAASDPALSLSLAREGNRRFKRSPDAPERASIIVRALSSMGRHDEARVEALRMEKEFPASSWTSDVHRHMFVNPPDHPAERGHGKTLELE